MSEIHLSEDEQVEALKRWWKQNGTAILVGMAIGIAGIAGFWYWQDLKHGKAERGSQVYTEFSEAIQANKQDVINTTLQTLQSDYHGTPYPSLACLTAAKRSVDKNDLASAENYLHCAMDQATHDSVAQLARVRLAAVFIQEKKLDDALRLVADQHDPAFGSDYAELRGDIYRMQGKPDMARAAYAEALAATEVSGQRRSFLEMKRDDLTTGSASANKS